MPLRVSERYPGKLIEFYYFIFQMLAATSISPSEF